MVRSENILSCSKSEILKALWAHDTKRIVVSATFAFGGAEGNVGVPLQFQLVLSSQAHSDSAPINIAQVKIAFGGGLKNISIHHKSRERGADSNLGSNQQHRVSLQEPSLESQDTTSDPSSTQLLSASAELTLAPGETTVITLTNVPRDAGEVHARSITVYINEEDFDVELLYSEDEQMRRDSFWFFGASSLLQRPLKAERTNIVKISPKPPKMRVSLPNVLGMYYVNENLTIDLDITNEEEEQTRGSLDVRLLGPPGMRAKMTWRSESELTEPLHGNALEQVIEDGLHKLPMREIEIMEPGAKQKHCIIIESASEAAEYSLQTEIHYCLLSDPQTPISKIYNTDLIFVQPFESTFAFAPRIHLDPWPDYFSVEDTDGVQYSEDGPRASGLIQRWSLTSRLVSLAVESLSIGDVSLKLDHVTPPESALCQFSSAVPSLSPASSEGPFTKLLSIEPGALRVYTHTLDVHKIDLEDRHTLSLGVTLQIQYHRSSESSHCAATSTTLHIPPLTLPFGEPRCLASFRRREAVKDSTIPRSIPLTYTIENPSSYTLTFSISMDNNEAFAFSGPKSLIIQLLPLSRRAIDYRIVPVIADEGSVQREAADGRWIWPHFVVVDTGFRKTLRVLPAAEGMKGGRKGEIGVRFRE